MVCEGQALAGLLRHRHHPCLQIQWKQATLSYATVTRDTRNADIGLLADRSLKDDPPRNPVDIHRENVKRLMTGNFEHTIDPEVFVAASSFEKKPPGHDSKPVRSSSNSSGLIENAFGGSGFNPLCPAPSIVGMGGEYARGRSEPAARRRRFRVLRP